MSVFGALQIRHQKAIIDAPIGIADFPPSPPNPRHFGALSIFVLRICYLPIRLGRFSSGCFGPTDRGRRGLHPFIPDARGLSSKVANGHARLSAAVERLFEHARTLCRRRLSTGVSTGVVTHLTFNARAVKQQTWFRPKARHQECTEQRQIPRRGRHGNVIGRVKLAFHSPLLYSSHKQKEAAGVGISFRPLGNNNARGSGG